MSRYCIQSLLFTGLITVSQIGLSQSGESSGFDLEQATKDANYIIKGEVTKVEYRMSKPDSEGHTIPYTFVTYNIEQEIKGGHGASEYTLRYLGGPIDEDNFMISDGQPLMDVGEKDILFVNGNGTTDCPLVGCQKGRLREIDGFIFNDQGQSIVMDDAGNLRNGEVVKHEQFMKHKMTDSIELTFDNPELEGEEYGIKGLEPIAKEQGYRPDVNTFSTMISDTVTKVHTEEELNNLQEETSQNPEVPFDAVVYEEVDPGEDIEDFLEHHYPQNLESAIEPHEVALEQPEVIGVKSPASLVSAATPTKASLESEVKLAHFGAVEASHWPYWLAGGMLLLLIGGVVNIRRWQKPKAA